MTLTGQGALSGLRVVDCSRFIAGPYCGMFLGDLGADVVKVERPQGGDEARSFGPAIAGETLYVMVYNRNKRSVTIDFRHAEGPALLHGLAARADVLIENFRPGVMEAMGCDWPRLQALNTRLIMARVSGFGQDRPLAERPGLDVIGQAMGGLMHLTGSVRCPANDGRRLRG